LSAQAHRIPPLSSNAHSDEVIKFVEEKGLNPVYIMETHVHADHLTGARYLKEKYPKAKTCIGENITVVQQVS
jgi:glyoxylase-like metal-dependent hydrolase (beta-lactamase superfamily II)